MTTTVSLVCRAAGHDHDARLVSRFTDGRAGEWKPLPEFRRPLGEEFALVATEDGLGDLHLRYKFPCGAEITQPRLHTLLDEARALGNTEITLD